MDLLWTLRAEEVVEDEGKSDKNTTPKISLFKKWVNLMLQQTSSHSNVHQYTDRLIHQTFLNKIDCKGRQNAFKKYKNGQLKTHRATI